MRPSSLAQLLLDASGSGVKLYGWQARFLDDGSRFRIVLKSRGVGASYTIALEAVVNSLTKRGHTSLLVSYSQRQSLELFKRVREHISTLGRLKLRHGNTAYSLSHKTTKTSAEFSNNSRIIALPNNPDSLRGFRADHVYLDEAGMFRDDFSLKSALAFTTVAREGRLTLVSTPKGCRGWFYEVWSGEEGWSKHIVHYRDAPHITEKELDELRKVMTSLEWEQEMEMRFLREQEALFPYEQILRCVEDYQPSKPADGATTYMGIDFGRYRDSTVITGLSREPDGRLRICLLKELRQMDFAGQVKVIEEAVKILRPAVVAVDKTGLGIPIAEALARTIPMLKPVTITSPIKDSMVRALKNLVESGGLAIPADAVELINQLHLFQRRQTAAGSVRYEAPEGGHDDYVISLALAVHGALTHQRERLEMVSFWRWGANV